MRFANLSGSQPTGPNYGYNQPRSQLDGRDALYLNTVNYSTYAYLNAHAWTHSLGNSYMRTLFKFNLESIPVGATIQSATLHLYSDPNSYGVLSNQQISGSNAVYFEKVTANWTESTVIWNNQPATTTAGRIWQGPSTSTTENIQVNLSSFVQEWVNNPSANYGLMMKLENEQYYRARNYASEDHTNAAIRPKLVITYSTPFASTAPIGSYHRMADSLLHHLDKSGVTTGILYDRVMPLAGLHTFNEFQPDTSARPHFLQGYREMFRAAYDTTSWLRPEEVRDAAAGVKEQNKVPIALGNFQFNVIDTLALDLGLIQEIDSMYYDVPNRPRHPFLTKSVFLASPLADSTAGLTVTYDFSSALTFNKSDKTITSLQVDFGNGAGLVPVGLTGTATITYASPGWKILKFVAGFSNGPSTTTFAVLKVRPDPVPSPLGLCESNVTSIWSALPFQGYQNEAMPTTGKGELKVFYGAGTCDNKIRKPIIVVDGFDALDKEDADDIYDERLNKEDANGRKFAETLRNQGFDIIILNFPTYTHPATGEIRYGGGDYIERNARILMHLIDTVNTAKEGNEDLIIIGPSMGGLISQYALAYMEQHYMTHNTKLWVSFDSPHKGANVPLGDQIFLDFFAKEAGSDAAEEARDKRINSPAAKQMLRYHYLPNTYTDYFQRFYNSLNLLGFPNGDIGEEEDFRKIALVNGSLGGIEVNAPCQKGFTLDVRQVTKVNLILFKIHWKTVTIGSARMYFSPSYGNSCTVFEGSLWGNSRTTVMHSLPGSSGYDVAPGGTYNTQQQIVDETRRDNSGIQGPFWPFRFEPDFYSLVPTHSFINTKSALAFSGSNINLSENISTRNLTCTGETPFDSYFGQVSENTEHVAIWPEAGDWLASWIMGAEQPSSVVNTLYNITGADDLCTNQQATYTISNSSNATVVWGALPAGVSFVSSSGNSITVQVASSATFPLILKAEVTVNGCTYYTTKTINLTEPPAFQMFGMSQDGVCGDSEYTISAPLDPTWTYDWQVLSGGYISGDNVNSVTVQTDPYYGYPAIFKVRVLVTNACGGEKLVEQEVMINDCNEWMMAYPNPTEEEFTVSVEPGGTETATIDLYNSQGRKVRSLQAVNGQAKVKVNVRDLPRGNYFLHVIQNGKSRQQQVIIGR
ncbi:DNRLRE domain-containing protein [Rufibacter roseus]|uniref:DNRLRE domain-containing protein n=1 Tax=Rufibacter roseus TaxID=1567108 RepID=A0ABW2DEL3_9BACT|nr:DNRLRE domain-containing protein [Rufibacter roseus]